MSAAKHSVDVCASARCTVRCMQKTNAEHSARAEKNITIRVEEQNKWHDENSLILLTRGKLIYVPCRRMVLHF